MATRWQDCGKCQDKMARGHKGLSIDLYHYMFHDPEGNNNRIQGIMEGCRKIREAQAGMRTTTEEYF